MHWQLHKVGASTTGRPKRGTAAHAGRHRARRRSRAHLRRHRAAAAGHRRIPLRRLAARRVGRAGASARRTTSKCPPTPTSSSKATSTRPSGRRRRPVRRPHRLLLAARAVSRLPRHRASRTARTPIYPTTIVGRPPMEDYYLGKATERIFLPAVRMMLPEIVDIEPAGRRRASTTWSSWRSARATRARPARS